MDEMNKNTELENEKVENVIDNTEAQNTNQTEAAPQSENAETTEHVATQPNAETYYTYEQGTPVTPNATPAPDVKDKAKSKATTALVLGIIALVSSCLGCCCCLPVPVVLAIISLVMVKKSKKLSDDGKLNGLAIGALICSIFAIISYVVTLLITGLYAAIMLTDPEGKAILNDFLAEFGYELAF